MSYFLQGPEGYVNYIAAQGPLPGTVFDFWRMVWYSYATVIVMVCKEVEMGKVRYNFNWTWRFQTEFYIIDSSSNYKFYLTSNSFFRTNVRIIGVKVPEML